MLGGRIPSISGQGIVHREKQLMEHKEAFMPYTSTIAREKGTGLNTPHLRISFKIIFFYLLLTLTLINIVFICMSVVLIYQLNPANESIDSHTWWMKR